MYLYCEIIERHILIPKTFKTISEVRKQLFEDFAECAVIDDDEFTTLVNQSKFKEAYRWPLDNDLIDDENDINLDDNNLSAYCETHNHDNWDARVFKLLSSVFPLSP